MSCKKIAVLVIHGMGTFSKDYSLGLQKGIEKILKGSYKIYWQEVVWSKIFSKAEDDYYNEMKNSSNVDLLKLRKFVITALGDAASYHGAPSQTNQSYKLVHELFFNEISDLREKAEEDIPLVIFAHSLGALMISNYIWDIEKGKSFPKNDNPLEKFETLTGLITFGCNIPLYSFSYNPIMAITFPPLNLSQELKSKAKWLNFFDPDDILGYPLKPLSPSYNSSVTKDISIDVGGLLTSWNPLSHNEYWNDENFHKETADFIKTL